MLHRLERFYKNTFRTLLQFVLLLLLACGLTACGTNQDTDFMEGACVQLSNHSSERISTSYTNGVWTGGATPFAGNGGFCGVKLPAKWHEGLTVNVKWTNAEADASISKMLNGAETIWYEKQVAVPKYTTLNEPVLHFMPNGKIIMTMNLAPNQMPLELQYTRQPENWRASDNYYCEHLKLLTMTPKQCEKRMSQSLVTGE